MYLGHLQLIDAHPSAQIAPTEPRGGANELSDVVFNQITYMSA